MYRLFSRLHMKQPDFCKASTSGRSSRRRNTTRRWALCALAVLLSAPAMARADTTKEDENVDARLLGFPSNQTYMKSTGVGLTTMLFMGLAALGCGVLFKNANRSHLD